MFFLLIILFTMPLISCLSIHGFIKQLFSQFFVKGFYRNFVIVNVFCCHLLNNANTTSLAFLVLSALATLFLMQHHHLLIFTCICFLERHYEVKKVDQTELPFVSSWVGVGIGVDFEFKLSFGLRGRGRVLLKILKMVGWSITGEGRFINGGYLPLCKLWIKLVCFY